MAARVWDSKILTHVGRTLLAAMAMAVLACAVASSQSASRSFMILAMNDVYHIEGTDNGERGGLARLRTLRVELEREFPDLLLLHAGDALSPSLLSRIYSQAQGAACKTQQGEMEEIEGRHMVDVLNMLDGSDSKHDERMLVTFGNHDFEVTNAARLRCLLHRSQFTWLASNVRFVNDVRSQNLAETVILTSGGIRVGMFSLTIEAKAPPYITAFLPAEPLARRLSAELRKKGAEIVVALTHQTMEQDVSLLKNLGAEGPDLIIGGHEHEKMVMHVNGRVVLKADAEARTVTLVKVTLKPEQAPGSSPLISYQLIGLGPLMPHPDQIVADRVDYWLKQEDKQYCSQNKQPIGCLSTKLGKAGIELVGEELEMRRFESNLGNWIADLALVAFNQKADIAFINSGSLRLNQNIPAGAAITRRHIEELFPYPMHLRLIRIDGAMLQRIVSHAISDWTGNGRWLQISGFSFIHDPDRHSAGELTLLTERGPRPIRPQDSLLAVTNDFLLDTGRNKDQDGYTFLGSHQIMSVGSVGSTAGQNKELRTLAMDALSRSKPDGIKPTVEGRICNTRRGGPCLALTNTR
jgi:2',3'-cyclic-nucleotide 2'-phosphodiesterase (5'-nucleotidase family)